MNAPTKPQIIKGPDGQPAFAVVPYQEYMQLVGGDDAITLPHEVVKFSAIKGYSLLKSWRKYRGISQAQMAEKLGVTQGNISQVEALDNKPNDSTLAAWADVLNCNVLQLQD